MEEKSNMHIEIANVLHLNATIVGSNKQINSALFGKADIYIKATDSAFACLF